MLRGRDLQVVNGFYLRAFGPGPWCFLAPEDVNRLPAGASLCGSLNAVAEGWVATAGTIVYDATQTAPIVPSGVLRWSGATNTSQAGVGTLLTGALSANTGLACPYVAALAACGSLYVATATGTASVRAQLLGINSAGAVVATINGSTVTATTTPQQISAPTAAGGGSTALYWVLAIECLSSSAPDLLISCAQLEVGVTTPSAWGAGSGVARVIIPAGFDAPVDASTARNLTLTLGQI
jgi:hypothetical protein